MGEPSSVPAVIELVLAQSRTVLETYRIDPGLIQEHANGERRISQGGYGDRQLFELVQNAADEIQALPGGEIAVVLTESHLYCANQGSPVTPEGADTILRMGTSRKRGGQIGRFGVGVKSVLAISDAPEFFSTENGVSFGFGFDRSWSARQIRTVHGSVGETPVLRMARVLDPDGARASDPVLDELLRWATTVVRLPLTPGSSKRLGEDVGSFPVEFPLFSPHVGTITLDDRRAGGARRQIDHRATGARRVLEELRPDGTTVQHSWRVFTRSHRPSAVAVGDAGELHDRPEIDVSWAVPERTSTRGTFWAYFPTKFATTLRGILNAPWKTSEDRQAIFDGNAFNNELLNVAASLVVDSLPSLGVAEDPAAYVDYLPGRGREAPQFADERLTIRIWDAAGRNPSLVDQVGVFRRPDDIRLHPENLREEWLKEWAGYPGRPEGWVHHSAERRERRARVALIMGRAGRRDASVTEWLEALVSDGSAKASAAALRIAAGMMEADHEHAAVAGRARILLTETGAMVAPIRGQVFRRSSADALADGIVYVDDRVVAEFGAQSALDVLGVRDADAAGRFAAVVDQGFDGYDDQRWSAFWELSRAAGPTVTLDLLTAQPPGVIRMIKVRTMAGSMRSVYACMRPGPVVPADGSRDAAMTVDVEFHAADMEVVSGLGVPDRPVPDHDPREEPWFDDYVEYAWGRHIRTLGPKDRRPQKATMRVDGANPPGPLRFMLSLSEEGRAAFLQALPGHGLVSVWTVQVGRQQATRMNVMSPLLWMARDKGSLRTSRGLRPVPRCVAPTLHEHGRVLAVARASAAVATALRLPMSLDKVPDAVWAALVEEAAGSTDDDFPGSVYALLIGAGAEWPEGAATRCRIGDDWSSERPDEEIAVTALRAEYELLRREGVPALLVPTPEDAAAMIEGWHMLSPEDVITKEVRFVAESEPQSLLDLFPHLRVTHRQKVEGWSLMRCSELEEITRGPNGIRSAPLRQAVQDHAVLVLRPSDDQAALEAVDVALGLGLGVQGCRSVLERRRRQQESDRIRSVREATTKAEKILRLVGEEPLRAGLPRGLEEAEIKRTGAAPSGERLAQLALNTHGGGILRHHAKDIAAADEAAPRTFSGTTASRRYVAELGLPEAFAGSSVVAPPEMEEVDGPSELPPLHDYQEQVAGRMVDLLLSPEPKRGMLRLPTGAGKTRVAVEAVTRFVRRRGRPPGPVLWIAQSNELCEQAVASWKFVWSKAGPAERLTINRFWGSNDAAPVLDATQLVVATDAQLHRRLGQDAYAWLRDASVVIVDEAHRALAPEYTGILDALGINRYGTARPLIGLTATPFRGRNEDETKRLVTRFGGHRLDEDLFGSEDPYVALQGIGVLAKVDHRILRGSDINLTPAQVESMETYGVLPPSAEEELGLDADRNQMLVHEIAGLPEDWPVLVFATSVEHSKLLTAQLNDIGVGSTSIDSYTPMAERRYKIEAYRTGARRVITNYGVLAQGFDAPRTRAVVIARPTYSPNMYQQMIGRGLRGPLNGGEDTCLILDVDDNVQNYGGSLAFTEFEHLWART